MYTIKIKNNVFLGMGIGKTNIGMKKTQMKQMFIWYQIIHNGFIYTRREREKWSHGHNDVTNACKTMPFLKLQKISSFV